MVSSQKFPRARIGYRTPGQQAMQFYDATNVEFDLLGDAVDFMGANGIKTVLALSQLEELTLWLPGMERHLEIAYLGRGAVGWRKKA